MDQITDCCSGTGLNDSLVRVLGKESTLYEEEGKIALSVHALCRQHINKRSGFTSTKNIQLPFLCRTRWLFVRHRTCLNTCDRFFGHLQLSREDPFRRYAIDQGV